ncbi:hypothetical protein ACFVZH_25765 [Streptomyces sp. NPDC059534]|uniref:hypothetical protein n=1 Tax=Streptomyces sp. NPDC059534 TaxID=3346859 RepID=UPI0036778DD3
MGNSTRKTAAAGAAALLAASLVTAVAATTSEAAPAKPERITSVAQLKESVKAAAELERQNGEAGIGGSTGGQVTRLASGTAC